MRISRAHMYAWGFALLVVSLFWMIVEGMRKIPEQWIITAVFLLLTAIAFSVIMWAFVLMAKGYTISISK